MSGLNKKIDEYARSEKRKYITFGIAISLLIATGLSFIFMPNMGATSQVSGVVTRLIGKENAEFGPILYLAVKLDNGENVRSRIYGSSSYRKGKRVSLDKVEAKTFGNPTYVFRGYVENE